MVTNVLGINTAGDVVGNYEISVNGPSHGFLYSRGNFTFFDYPAADSTIPRGINDSNEIVGYAYVQGNTAAVGFLYDDVSFANIGVPGKADTLAWGIDNAGIVVGGDGITLDANQAFVHVGTKFRNVTPPGSYVLAYATGINNFGKIVGWTEGSTAAGFLYSGGKFQTLSVPGSTMTEALGINDSGIIVGWYATVPGYSGYALMHRKYISLNYPGAIYTFASGINNSGQIVGSYTLDQQTYHGFVTSPITAANFERSESSI